MCVCLGKAKNNEDMALCLSRMWERQTSHLHKHTSSLGMLLPRRVCGPGHPSFLEGYIDSPACVDLDLVDSSAGLWVLRPMFLLQAFDVSRWARAGGPLSRSIRSPLQTSRGSMLIDH